MKKFIISTAIFLISLNVFAKTWENNAGVGFTLPYSKIGVDEKGVDDITQLAFGANGFYLGVHESGFTVKTDLTAALTTSKDVNIQDHKTNAGFMTNTSIGLGYSFRPNDNWLISITGMFGMDASFFGDYEDDVEYNYDDVRDKRADYERTLGLVTMNVGADIFARYKIGEHIGFFTNLSARYLLGGWSEDETRYTYNSGRRDRTDKKSDKSDLLGYFRVQPTIGVCWTF